MTEQAKSRPLHQPIHAGLVGEVVRAPDHLPIVLPKRGWSYPLKGHLRIELRPPAGGLSPRRGKATVVFQVGTRRFEEGVLAFAGGPPEPGWDAWIVGEVQHPAGVTSESRWRALWHRAGLEKTPWALHAQLLREWTRPHRVYHDLQHLLHALLLAEEHVTLAKHPVEVELALWFHDAVMDPKGEGDDVGQSAQLAAGALPATGLADDAVKRVGELVEATRHDGTPLAGDAALVSDIDLAILGSEPGVYDGYAWDLRAEYGWVPEAIFNAKRREFVQALLRTPRLFWTPVFHDLLERPAKDNLARELSHLPGE